MRAFVVMQWNGHDYTERIDSAAGIFATLEEAAKYCEDTPAFIGWSDQVKMNKLEAYDIFEFDGGIMLNEYYADGKVKPKRSEDQAKKERNRTGKG